MIIEDKVKLKVKRKTYKSKKKGDIVYKMFFISFSIKYAPILSKFREIHNTIILTENEKIVLPSAIIFKHSYYYSKRTGQKIPVYSITIPRNIAEELWNKGARKLKVIVELPDLKTPVEVKQ